MLKSPPSYPLNTTKKSTAKHNKPPETQQQQGERPTNQTQHKAARNNKHIGATNAKNHKETNATTTNNNGEPKKQGTRYEQSKTPKDSRH